MSDPFNDVDEFWKGQVLDNNAIIQEGRLFFDTVNYVHPSTGRARLASDGDAVGSALYPRMWGPPLVAGDSVMCGRSRNGKAVVLGKVSGSAVDNYAPTVIPVPLDLIIKQRDKAKKTTTNTASYTTILTQDVTIPIGSWGCEVGGSALLWRTVATGESWLRLRVGGYNEEASLLASDGLSLTSPMPLVAVIDRFATNSIITVATPTIVTVAVDFRGGVTAGTTNMVNCEMHGFFYRIS